MKKLQKRKGIYGVIVRKDEDGYFVVAADYYISAEWLKQEVQYLANFRRRTYIPLFFRNHYQAAYYGLEIGGVTRLNLPDRHRGHEYKPTA